MRSPQRRHPTHHLTMSLQEPPVHVKTTFGFMGAVGVVVNIVLFIVDIVSDALLAYVLWKQADKMENKDVQSELFTWFIITLCIIILPMVVINIFSLLWYWQNKICLGDYCVLHKMSTSQAIIRVFIHLLLLGPLIRYLDILRYGIKMKREVKHVEMGTNGAHVQRRTPRGEVHAVLHMIIGRDTAMLDMMHSFLQDAPQLIFQIFLLYRSPKIIIGTEKISPTTTAVQVWKVLLGVFAMSWSLVSYQDELRRTVPNKTPLSCCATTTCLFWRAAMITSRIIAIGSFTAILPAGQNPQTALSLSWTDSGGNLVIPYPVVAMCILIGHWLIMTAWLHAQGTTFCSQENGSGRPVLELLYNCVMGLVHIFCYINVKDTPSRRRMVFFYTFCLIENSAIIAVWYVEMVMFPEWFRVGLIFSVEMLWLVGLCCVIGYYGFLHPDHTDLIQHREQASWRR
ncbi:XK-related protein 6-like isoform X3 [Homarus americanus]|uniref:XK-related protein 6-like isoform X3 n=1 Tax=Homarus americanus TaxID=6706 RepID=UPI001C46D84D|nr:XK-related protein 6-like isoform X3 [Homarus americanus]